MKLHPSNRRNPAGVRPAGGGSLSTTMSLDPSSKTGWALSTGQSGVFDLTDSLDLGETVWRFQQWLAGKITTHRVRRLIVERPFIITRSESALLPGHLAAAAHAVAHGHEVEREEVSPPTWRKVVLGNGGLSTSEAKKAAIRWCQLNGYKPADDNEAEAICILEYLRLMDLGRWAA